MIVVCIARHPMLAEHLCTLVAAGELRPIPAVGLEAGLTIGAAHDARAILCDYELLVPIAPERWTDDPLLVRSPIIATSLTRRPEEAVSAHDGYLAAYLYLPMLSAASVSHLVRSVIERFRDGRSGAVRAPADALPPLSSWDAPHSAHSP